MEFRIDIAPTESGPKLVGLWLTGWAWLLGGARVEKHSIHGRLVGADSNSEKLLRALDEENRRKKGPSKLWASGFREDRDQDRLRASHTSPQQEELEIEQTLVLSTSHITEEDSRLLNPDVGFLAVIEHDQGYGWFVRVPDADGFEELPNQLEAAGFSTCLSHLLSVAQSHNCAWIQLDADGPCYASLPQYHW